MFSILQFLDIGIDKILFPGDVWAAFYVTEVKVRYLC